MKDIFYRNMITWNYTNEKKKILLLAQFPQNIWKKIIGNTALAILCSYLVGIFIGGIILFLPISTHQGISFTDAIFTAASALCVTGLAVQDTGTCFTLFGQWMILIFIQLGGLGILTLSAFIIRLLSGRLGLNAKSWLEDSLGHYAHNMYAFVKQVFIIVFSIELVGAILLFLAFWPNYTFLKSIYLAIFHSISAFCNAGFSTFSNSLESYRTSSLVNITIISLIFLGGLGFMVIEDIRAYFFKQSKALSFHTKIVLNTSFFLILAGFIVTILMESQKSFANFSWDEKIWAALFQSVSCRTAGFNTVPIGNLYQATLFFFILLMFIGGSPGSMAGGVKTTSFALMMVQIKSRLQGRNSPEIFHRTVSQKYMEKVFTLFIAATTLVTISVFLLLITENNTEYMKNCKDGFLTIFFEVVSALGTVGLTAGITPYLTDTGKWIVSIIMLIGRIGPLSLAILLMSINPELDYQYPEEEVMIG